MQRMQDTWKNAPIDETSAERLASKSLRYALVDTGDDAALDAWVLADVRGFHGPAPERERLERTREFCRQQRVTGVWPETASAGAEPVATVSSWIGELTVPGPAVVEGWAISSVTVAQTHRGLGIARALLEGELRTAAALDVPYAMLTVSESTLYGRYGFGNAAGLTDLTFETSRITWTGPRPAGSLEYVDHAVGAGELERLHDLARAVDPGDVSTLEGFWQRVTGAHKPDDEQARAKRIVAYRDEHGETTGVLVYRMSDEPRDFTKHVLTVETLVTTTDDAYAALWRFVLEMPLVATVEAHLRRLDEPVRWMVGDFRAVKSESYDHHWVRVLDVARALGARRYGAAGRAVLDVRDDLGFASGRYLLEIDADGDPAVERVDEAPAGTPSIALDVAALSSISLGGVSLDVLARTGRVDASDPDAVALVDRMFRTPREPWLSTWY